MSPALTKLSHVALSTPNLEQSRWFFKDLIGMEEVEQDETRIYLRCANERDHHSLTLREGPVGIEHIAFRVSGPDDLAAYEAQLRDIGVETTAVAAGGEAGQGDALRFTMPHVEVPIELVWDIDRPLSPEPMRSKAPSASTKFWRQGVSPRRIDHLSVQTTVEGTGLGERWMTEQFGFKRREYVEVNGQVALSFLSVTPQVHDVALSIDGENRPGRFHHVAFAVEDMSAILRAADMMREHDIKVDLAPGRHGIAQSYCYYVREPGSGHRVELYAGGYVIYDPDWEPVRWDESNLLTGTMFFGPDFVPGSGGPMDANTPCAIASEPAASAVG
jgi:catechol 2,3-dioxygenase